MSEPTHIEIRGKNGKVERTVPILRTVTLRGVPGFCIHQYEDEYRVSHIETGAFLCRALTDGEVFVNARRFDKAELENKIAQTRRELARLLSYQKG